MSVIRITKDSINSRFEFFKRVCIEECINTLGNSIPPVDRINIIENVPQNYGFFKDTGGALCHIKFNNKTISCEIYISENIMDYYTKITGEKDPREKFLKSINVTPDEYSLFLIVLLHEFGHANLIKLFHDAGIMNDYTIFDSMNESLLNILKSRMDSLVRWEVVHKNLDLIHIINGVESQSDIFARDNFMPIWVKVNKILKNYTLSPN